MCLTRSQGLTYKVEYVGQRNNRFANALEWIGRAVCVCRALRVRSGRCCCLKETESIPPFFTPESSCAPLAVPSLHPFHARRAAPCLPSPERPASPQSESTSSFPSTAYSSFGNQMVDLTASSHLVAVFTHLAQRCRIDPSIGTRWSMTVALAALARPVHWRLDAYSHICIYWALHGASVGRE